LQFLDSWTGAAELKELLVVEAAFEDGIAGEARRLEVVTVSDRPGWRLDGLIRSRFLVFRAPRALALCRRPRGLAAWT
jgi:hypothetical protein